MGITGNVRKVGGFTSLPRSMGDSRSVVFNNGGSPRLQGLSTINWKAAPKALALNICEELVPTLMVETNPLVKGSIIKREDLNSIVDHFNYDRAGDKMEIIAQIELILTDPNRKDDLLLLQNVHFKGGNKNWRLDNLLLKVIDSPRQ